MIPNLPENDSPEAPEKPKWKPREKRQSAKKTTNSRKNKSKEEDYIEKAPLPPMGEDSIDNDNEFVIEETQLLEPESSDEEVDDDDDSNDDEPEDEDETYDDENFSDLLGVNVREFKVEDEVSDEDNERDFLNMDDLKYKDFVMFYGNIQVARDQWSEYKQSGLAATTQLSKKLNHECPKLLYYKGILRYCL